MCIVFVLSKKLFFLQVICPETSTVISTDSNPEEPKVSQERQTHLPQYF
jgi:hypothetical protein